MQTLSNICGAVNRTLTGFIDAQFEKEASKPHSLGVVFRLAQKSSFSNSALIGLSAQHPTNGAFSISAASDAIDNLLTSARCTGKIGLRLPLANILAALVERPHNLFGYSGKISELWIKLTRHAHLVLA